MPALVYHRHLLPAADRDGDRECIVDGSQRLTLSEHCDRVLRLVDAIAEVYGSGCRFAVLQENSHRYIELHHAALLGAGTIVPLNTRLLDHELTFLLDDARPAVLFSDQPLSSTALRCQQRCTAGFDVIAGPTEYETLLSSGRPVTPSEPGEGDVAMMMYTGGTTGRPKAALLTHRAELLNAQQVDRVLDFGAHRRHLHQVPMFHAAAMGQLIALPMNGGLSVVAPRFEPSLVLDLIEQERIDQTVMVPTSVAMLLASAEFSPTRMSSLTDLVYGAAPMPPALLERMRTALPHVRLHQGYGMTEAAQAVTVLGDHDHAAAGGLRARSAGRPVPGVELSIREEDGTVRPTGEHGEVWVRGGNLFEGYWERPEETAAALTDGWFHTGDVGYVDTEGYLFLLDRAKDMIKPGGENVYSLEVEAVLSRHEGVAEAAVIGAPDPTWGERVHAVVVRRSGGSISAEVLDTYMREHLSAYKVPRSYEVRDAPLPLSAAGKVLKRQLRDELAAAERHARPFRG